MSGDWRHWYQGRHRLKQLQAFCQVARLGNMSRAAEHAGTSQPAVSVQVRALETELGVALFERRGPHISLTRAGRSLYDLAIPLVQGMERLLDSFADRHHRVVGDTLRIGAGQTSATYLVPRYLERFRERYPGISIEMRTGTGRQRLKWLRDYELDLVVGAMDPPPNDIDFHPVLRSELVLVTAMDHPLAGRESVTVEEMAGYPFVGHASTQRFGQIMETAAQLRGLTLDIGVEVDGWDAITNYVAAGAGVSVVPDLCLTGRDDLRRISLNGAFRSRCYGAMTRRDGLLAPPVRRLLAIIVPELSDTPGER